MPLTFIQRRFQSAKKLIFQSSPKAGIGDEQVINCYRQFINTTLEQYKFDFIEAENMLLAPSFFNRFWKVFLDELLMEKRRLLLLHAEEFEDQQTLDLALKELTEQGMENFKKMAQGAGPSVDKIRLL